MATYRSLTNQDHVNKNVGVAVSVDEDRTSNDQKQAYQRCLVVSVAFADVKEVTGITHIAINSIQRELQ